MQFKSFPSLDEAVDFVRLKTAGSKTSLMYTIDTGERSLEGAELNALLLAGDKLRSSFNEDNVCYRAR